jgi:hypothetical protein
VVQEVDGLTNKLIAAMTKHNRQIAITITIVVITTIISALALNLGGTLAVALTQSPRVAHFPTLAAFNLEKRAFNLPADFEGENNLLLVAFEREQQKDVDTWLREMKRFETVNSGPGRPHFQYYELPTIERPIALTRWFIDSGMRRGIPDRKARERTITLYLDKKPFCEALLINDQKTIYEFLVNRNGDILWRSQGAFDETKAASLNAVLTQGHK